MAQVQSIVLLACFLVGSSATVSIEKNWPPNAASSLLYQLTSTESERNSNPSSCNGQCISYERLHAPQFKGTDLDHPDSRGLQLHASQLHHIQERNFHDPDHETDSRSHGLSHAVSLLEASFGEADALLEFKDGVGNFSEGALDDWTTGKRSDYCSWTRVTCNGELHVTALNLSSLHMNGSLGPSLSNLSYLEELHLDQNYLKSEIPPELGRLSRLRILNLEDNLLYGNIPKELGNLTSLQELNLGSEGWWFNGTIPEELGQLSELEFLNLGAVNNANLKDIYHKTDQNKLRGTVPRSLGNCTKLWYLDFYGNDHLTSAIPEELGKLSNLQYLSFEQNNFTGTVPHQLGNLTQLYFLHFGNNALQGPLPVGLANMSRLFMLNVGTNFFTGNFVNVRSTSWSALTYLFADGNLFTGKFPELIFSASNLVRLYINNNNFTGKLPADLGRLSSAMSIVIRNNMFEGELPESLTNISLLTRLDLSNNKFSGPLDPLRNLTVVKNLNLGTSSESKSSTWESLRGRPKDLVQNSFTGSLTDEMVRQWPNLQYLYLDHNALIGKIPRALGNLTQLLHLLLNENKFDGDIPEELGDLQNLQLLWLQDNELTGKIPASLANLRDVTEINLGHNSLTGSIPQQFSNLTKIRFLRLHMNNLTGEIPPGLGKLQNLEYLILYNNTLNGSIPVTLSNCSALQNIRLSYNSMTGQLTHINFTQFASLNSFSVNGNKFSGRFPVTVWNCANLQLLDLSRNHFLGVLPNFDVLNPQLHEAASQGLNLSSLRVLSLASNYFSGFIPSSFWKLPALQVLDLSSNAFTGRLPRDLSGLVTYKLPTDEIQHQAANQISKGNLFEQISLRKADNYLEYTYVLEALTSLDVSRNQLTGELPAELGTLLGLRYLFMANNRFEGSIPDELGDIPDLSDLDLSVNQLSGPIPVSLSRLRLSYLNLSLNQLCGPIPVADSFETRLSESFLPGNPKLCGDYINKTCPSSGVSCGGDLDHRPVTELVESLSLYSDGVFMTAFAVGAPVGFVTVIGLITTIPALRDRLLHGTMHYAPFEYGLYREPS
ncbi:hypothetical protein Mapa_007476 [Marchantia paleacea]|nr:hypothetical protein Mapa_007476 [Marchantia paleacea]